MASLEMESPLFNGGGVVKSLEDVKLMSATAVGAVLAGSYTLEHRAGNSPDGEVVYYHDEQTGITYNALGMPNKGLQAVASELPEMISIVHDHGKPFILNFAPVTADPVQEVIAMSRILAKANITNLDAIELNASCPNVVTEEGGRHELLSHHPEQLARVLFELSDIIANEVPAKALMVRISPFHNSDQARDTAVALEMSGVDIVSAFNTFPGGLPRDSEGRQKLSVPGGVGGQSGPGMTARAEEQTLWLADARVNANASFEIYGSNGISNGEDLRTRLELGASAVSATTVFWESRSWKQAADRILREYSASE